MQTFSCRWCGGVECALLSLCAAASAFAQGKPSGRDIVSIEPFDAYISGQHDVAPRGVVDPYTGREVDMGSAVSGQFTAPAMSYLRESQSSASPGLSYRLSNHLSLNYDPQSRRVDTQLRLAGDGKKGFSLRVRPREIRAVYTYRWD